MDGKKPQITVVMSVRNGSDYLSESIQSILDQSFQNFELIILDDASTDQTPSILKKIQDQRVKIITNEIQKGLTQSLNIALKHSNGQFIARMDADDISDKNRFSLQLDILKKNSKIGVVGSWASVINTKGMEVALQKLPVTNSDIKQNLFVFNPIKHSSVIFRKKLIDKYGDYDEKLDGAEDYDLWLRLAKHTNFVNIPEPLVKYRVHKEMVSEKEAKKVLASAIRARYKAIKVYKYPKSNCIYIAVPIFFYFFPMQLKKLVRQVLFKLGRLLLQLIQKTTILTSLGIRLVKITGKYPEPVHPKHLVNLSKPWFINYIDHKDVVLDIGCNNGQNTMKAAIKCEEVIGFDSDKNLLDIAKRDSLEKGITNIKYLRLNAENRFPFKNNFFDSVMFFAVLEHLINRNTAISEVNRVLKPKGTLLISVPNKNTTWKNIQKIFGLPYFSDDDHKLEYDKEEIIDFLEKFGFVVKDCHPVSFDMPLIGIIDLIGGFSLTLYKAINRLRRKLVLLYPNESVSFEIMAEKSKSL